MPRTRTMSVSPVIGSWTDSFLGRSYTQSNFRYQSTCTDEVGYPTPHPLTIERKVSAIGPVTGSSGRVSGGMQGHVVPEFFSFGRNLSHLGGAHGTASAVIARSNPSRPVVDIPVAIKELGDLPKLIQLAGRSIFKQGSRGGISINPNLFKDRSIGELIASGNLNWQFGWKPLIGDLLNLVGFADMVAKRQAELAKLYSGKGMRKKVKFGSGSAHQTEVRIVNSLGGWGADARLNRSSYWEAWGTIRWFPTSLPDINDPTHYTAAVRATLGLDLTMATIWEMIPFSWLIDWFTNVGDILSGMRNTVPATHGPVCLMLKQTTREEATPTFITPGLKWGGGFSLRETKSRQIGVVSILPSDMPFLGIGKLSILTSLGVLQAEGWRRRR